MGVLSLVLIYEFLHAITESMEFIQFFNFRIHLGTISILIRLQ